MNHLYRIVWNAQAACWQAVSEIAKGRGKSTAKTQTTGLFDAVSSESRVGEPRLRGLVLGIAAALLGVSAPLHAGPEGGNVVRGSASISSADKTTTINQSSDRAVINWSRFSVAADEAVRFNQPSNTSATLNRVTGAESSQIMGSLSANGHVFLINPNGVLIGAGAQVNVGGFIASSLDMDDEDFMSGKINLRGESEAAVTNEGEITAEEGGTVVLIAPEVNNTGTITANQGSVVLAGASSLAQGATTPAPAPMATPPAAAVAPAPAAVAEPAPAAFATNAPEVASSPAPAPSIPAGAAPVATVAISTPESVATTAPTQIASGGGNTADKFTVRLQDGSQIAFTIDKGAVNALVNNGGLIKAQGGHVILTAKGRDDLSKATVNHSGVIEAQTLMTRNGVVELLADMKVGEVKLNGRIDASARSSIDAIPTSDGSEPMRRGGFVETSAANVSVESMGKVTTAGSDQAAIATGKWLIDPHDFTIAKNGGDITGLQVSEALASNNFEIDTRSLPDIAEPGIIFVNDEVRWSSSNELVLRAQSDLRINSSIEAIGDDAQLVLGHGKYSNYSLGEFGNVKLTGNKSKLFIGELGVENEYEVINSIENFSKNRSATSMTYAALTNDLDLSSAVRSYALSNVRFEGFNNALSNSTREIFTIIYGTGGLRSNVLNLHIKNVEIDGATQSGIVAKIVKDSSLINVVVENPRVVIDEAFVSHFIGGVAGVAQGSVDCNQCHVRDLNVEMHAANSTSRAVTVGGVFGSVNGVVRINNSSANLTFSSEYDSLLEIVKVGGLVGHATGDLGINNSSSKSDIDVSNAYGTYETGEVYSAAERVVTSSAVGGLVAHSNATLSVDRSTADVRIKGYTSMGGLVGNSSISAKISDSYAIGSIEIPKLLKEIYSPLHKVTFGQRRDGEGYVAGGLIGYSTGNIDLNNVYSTVSHIGGSGVTANDVVVGGIVGSSANPVTNTGFNLWGDESGSLAQLRIGENFRTLDQMRLQDSFVGWDFENTWRIVEGSSYPMLNALTQGKITLTAEARDINKVYDRFAWSGGIIEYSGFTETDSPSSGILEGTLQWVGTAEGAINAGSYSLVPTGLYSQKYEVEYLPGTLTILPRPLDISVTKTYDGSEAFSSGYTVTNGVVVGDEVPTIVGTATVASANAGTYDHWSSNGLVINNPNYTLNLADVPGYIGPLGKVDATIEQTGLSLISVRGSRFYDGTNFANWNDGAQLTGVLDSDIANVFLASGVGQLDGVDAGVRQLMDVGSLKLGGSSALNYRIVSSGGEWLIKPRPVNVSGSKVYDGSDLINADILKVDNTLPGDDVQFSGNILLNSADAGDGKTMASAIVQSNNGNYQLNEFSGFDFTIKKRPLVVWVNDKSIEPRQPHPVYDYTVFDANSGENLGVRGIGRASLSNSSSKELEIGWYPIYFFTEADGNHEILRKYDGTLLVVPPFAPVNLITRERLRRELNGNLPSYSQAVDVGSPWVRVPDAQAVLHNNGYGAREIKFIHPDGREVIFDGDSLLIEDNFPFWGTFNFKNPVVGAPITDSGQVDHLFSDVLPALPNEILIGSALKGGAAVISTGEVVKNEIQAGFSSAKSFVDDALGVADNFLIDTFFTDEGVYFQDIQVQPAWITAIDGGRVSAAVKDGKLELSNTFPWAIEAIVTPAEGGDPIRVIIPPAMESKLGHHISDVDSLNLYGIGKNLVNSNPEATVISTGIDMASLPSGSSISYVFGSDLAQASTMLGVALRSIDLLLPTGDDGLMREIASDFMSDPGVHASLMNIVYNIGKVPNEGRVDFVKESLLSAIIDFSLNEASGKIARLALKGAIENAAGSIAKAGSGGAISFLKGVAFAENVAMSASAINSVVASSVRGHATIALNAIEYR